MTERATSVRIPFVKMHGASNDYVYVDDRAGAVESLPHLAEIVRRMSDRHRGIGGDGLILLCEPRAAARARGAVVRMKMFNADGSEGAMCGNGIRCVAKFAHDRLGLGERRGAGARVVVETASGIKPIDCHLDADGRVAAATVGMGEPRLDPGGVPMLTAGLKPGSRERSWVLPVGGAMVEVVPVSMGNPHAVVFVDAVDGVDLPREGAAIESHPAFPDRANAHFAEIVAPGRARVRTWERGSGATMACGTGACAVAVAGVVTGRLPRHAVIVMPGGELTIEWDAAAGGVFKTGPAEDVFEGVWPG